MAWLVWIGALMTVAGLGLLIYCIAQAFRLRKSGLSDWDIRQRLQKLVAFNMAALGLSGLGLMAVIIGLFLR